MVRILHTKIIIEHGRGHLLSNNVYLLRLPEAESAYEDSGCGHAAGLGTFKKSFFLQASSMQFGSYVRFTVWYIC